MNTSIAVTTENVDKYEDFWYAASVQSSCETIVAKQIAKISDAIDTWVATTQETHCLSRGRKVKVVDVVLLPAYVFFRFPRGWERKHKYDPILEIKKLTKVFRLVMDLDHEYGEWEGAHIPNIQIERLKYILEMSDTPVDIDTKTLYVKGDRVRVVRGNLIGLEGTISRDDKGNDRIYVTIDSICCASTKISRNDVEYIRRRPGRPRKAAV